MNRELYRLSVNPKESQVKCRLCIAHVAIRYQACERGPSAQGQAERRGVAIAGAPAWPELSRTTRAGWASRKFSG